MKIRSKNRKKALDILYEAQQKRVLGTEIVTERESEPIGEKVEPYAKEIIFGVTAKKSIIDEYLETYSQGWDISRMPLVDLTILRIGAWELLYNSEVPDIVAISEAVGLAKLLSTDDSPNFINGLLGRLLQLKPTLML